MTKIQSAHDDAGSLREPLRLAAAGAPAAAQARVLPGQDLAPSPGSGLGGDQGVALCPAVEHRDAGRFSVAAAGDPGGRRRGDPLRGPAGRRPDRPGGQGSVRQGPGRRLRRPGRRGAQPGGDGGVRSGTVAGSHPGVPAPAGQAPPASRRGRGDRLLRSQRPRCRRGAALRDREPPHRGGRDREKGGNHACRAGETARSDLGDPPGRSRRPHRVGLADPPVHRPGGPVQVRVGQRLCPGTRRDPLRHVRGRVHARGRSLHLRGPAGQAVPAGTGTPGHRRDRPRHRPEGRQVRAGGGGGHQDADRGHRGGNGRRQPAPGARRDRVRGSLRILSARNAIEEKPDDPDGCRRGYSRIRDKGRQARGEPR